MDRWCRKTNKRKWEREERVIYSQPILLFSFLRCICWENCFFKESIFDRTYIIIQVLIFSSSRDNFILMSARSFVAYIPYISYSYTITEWHIFLVLEINIKNILFDPFFSFQKKHTRMHSILPFIKCFNTCAYTYSNLINKCSSDIDFRYLHSLFL